MITNEQLRATFVNANMKYYFDRKLAPLPSEEVDARIEELLKYLNMALHSHGGIPFSDEIDDVWHYWILQTKEYAALCRKLDGGKFIHHSSNDYEEFLDAHVRERSIDLNRAVSLLSSYVLNYGPFEASRVKYWPAAAQLIKLLGWSVDRFNAWLASVSARNHAGKPIEARQPATAEAC
jgi:hypothetical protein